MVSMSRMCTFPMGDLHSTFRISHPMPPTPTMRICVLRRVLLVAWMRLLRRKGCDGGDSILQLLLDENIVNF